MSLQKPDITAADGVATDVPPYPPPPAIPEKVFNPFYGTSAAAPNAAGIAALLWSYYPGLTAAEVRNAFTTSAMRIEGTAISSTSGYGIVMADLVLRAIPRPKFNPATAWFDAYLPSATNMQVIVPSQDDSMQFQATEDVGSAPPLPPSDPDRRYRCRSVRRGGQPAQPPSADNPYVCSQSYYFWPADPPNMKPRWPRNYWIGEQRLEARFALPTVQQVDLRLTLDNASSDGASVNIALNGQTISDSYQAPPRPSARLDFPSGQFVLPKAALRVGQNSLVMRLRPDATGSYAVRRLRIEEP